MRAVFFDLDGTLVDLPDDFEAVFYGAMDDHRVSADDEHREYYAESFFEYLDECHPAPCRAAMADLCEEFGLVVDFEELADAYVEHEVAGTAVEPGTAEALDALDAPLGVLTNGATASQHGKLAHHGLDEYFDATIISGEVGAAKPDPEIFAAAKDAVPADEYVFVSDDLERDVLPAQEAGFTGVYLAEGDSVADSATGDGRADATVSSVRDVPRVLD